MPSTAPLPGQVGGQAGQAGSLGVASPRLSAWDNGGWETTFSGFGDVGFDAPAALHSSCRAQVLTAVSPARRPCASAGDREDTLATSTNSNATPAPATVAPPAPGLSTTPTTAGLSEYDWRQLSEADLTSISDKSKVATAQHVLGRYDLKDASRAEQALRLALRERSRSEAISVESNAPSTVAAPRPPPPSVVLDDSPASCVTATGSRRAPVRDHLAQQQKTLKPTRRDGALLYGVPAAAPTVSDSSSSSSAPASSSSSLTRINPPGWSETAPPEVKTARPAAEWAGWSQVELTRPAARPVQHDPDSTAAPRRDIRTATSSDATPTRARGARASLSAPSGTVNAARELEWPAPEQHGVRFGRRKGSALKGSVAAPRVAERRSNSGAATDKKRAELHVQRAHGVSRRAALDALGSTAYAAEVQLRHVEGSPGARQSQARAASTLAHKLKRGAAQQNQSGPRETVQRTASGFCLQRSPDDSHGVLGAQSNQHRSSGVPGAMPGRQLRGGGGGGGGGVLCELGNQAGSRTIHRPCHHVKPKLPKAKGPATPTPTPAVAAAAVPRGHPSQGQGRLGAVTSWGALPKSAAGVPSKPGSVLGGGLHPAQQRRERDCLLNRRVLDWARVLR